MTTEQIVGLLLALLVMLVGLGGTMIPGVPGMPLVLLAAGAHRLWFGDAGVSNIVLVILTLLTLLSLGIDYLASVLGAQRLGATWRGVLGAVLGATVGILFAIPGVIIGPFLGAVAFEMLGGREWKDATRAGVGALIGVFVGVLGKVICCAIMIGLFAINVVARSSASPKESAPHPTAEGVAQSWTRPYRHVNHLCADSHASIARLRSVPQR